MKFTDDLISATGTAPTISVRYMRETHGMVAWIHGFNGVKILRKLNADNTIEYVKREIPHKPVSFNGQLPTLVDDTPENRFKIAHSCDAGDFAISRDDWEMIDGDAILEGKDAEEAEIAMVSDEPESPIPEKKTRVQKKKTKVQSKKTAPEDKELTFGAAE